MNAVAFDTHAAVKQLREHGFEEPQAEAIVTIVSSNNDSRLGEIATKSQLNEVKADLELKIEQLRSELLTAIGTSRDTTIKWIAGLMLPFAGLIIAAIKLI